MNVNFVNTIPPSSNSETQASDLGDTIDKDMFLRLLVTQLKYQNPVNPMNNEQFISQSAQFSSLEQMRSLNESVQALLESQKSMYKTATLGLIGKEVVVQDSEISLSNGSSTDLNYSLLSDASVTISIYDSQGNCIRTIDAGEQLAGVHSVTWDGLDDGSVRAPDGEYSFGVSAIDADGNEVSVYGTVSGIVDGIVTSGDSIYLSIGGSRIPVERVAEVWESNSTE